MICAHDITYITYITYITWCNMIWAHDFAPIYIYIMIYIFINLYIIYLYIYYDMEIWSFYVKDNKIDVYIYIIIGKYDHFTSRGFRVENSTTWIWFSTWNFITWICAHEITWYHVHLHGCFTSFGEDKIRTSDRQSWGNLRILGNLRF